jgi:hypothetical protein
MKPMTVVPALLLIAGCAADGYGGARYSPSQSAPGQVAPAQYAPQPAAPTQDAPKEEKRGNTPPGVDRTGGGPASGAILDPTGSVTKEPVLRER